MPIKKQRLDDLYKKYNKREFVHPDPLEFLYNYKEAADKEIVGLIASSLAYGRVAQILKSVSAVLDKMGSSPRRFLFENKASKIAGFFPNFRHRFHTSRDISSLLIGIKNTVEKYGSLEKCFLSGLGKKDENVVTAMTGFVNAIYPFGGRSMLSSPEKGSACKKLNLYLRWMVRRDNVDPGGWNKVDPSMLVVPLDTHMQKIALMFSFTKRKQANMKTAIEITKAFAEISPSDPVKYDFALTRFGIRGELDIKDLNL